MLAEPRRRFAAIGWARGRSRESAALVGAARRRECRRKPGLREPSRVAGGGLRPQARARSAAAGGGAEADSGLQGRRGAVSGAFPFEVIFSGGFFCRLTFV